MEQYRWGSGPPPREAALSAAAHVLSPKAVTPVRRALPPAAFIDETDAVVTKNFKRTGQAGNLFSSRYLSADPGQAAGDDLDGLGSTASTTAGAAVALFSHDTNLRKVHLVILARELRVGPSNIVEADLQAPDFRHFQERLADVP